MSTETGGAAFPHVGHDRAWVEDRSGVNVEHIPHSGMTLLDYFAGQALAGCLAYSHVNPMIGNYHENCTVDALAQHAYQIASAMLTERAKRAGGGA